MIRASTTRRRLHHPVSLRGRQPAPRRHDVHAPPAPADRDRGNFLTPRLYPEALWDHSHGENFVTPRL